MSGRSLALSLSLSPPQPRCSREPVNGGQAPHLADPTVDMATRGGRRNNAIGAVSRLNDDHTPLSVSPDDGRRGSQRLGTEVGSGRRKAGSAWNAFQEGKPLAMRPHGTGASSLTGTPVNSGLHLVGVRLSRNTLISDKQNRFELLITAFGWRGGAWCRPSGKTPPILVFNHINIKTKKPKNRKRA